MTSKAYFTGVYPAGRACPVAPGDGTGVAPGDGTGVKFFEKDSAADLTGVKRSVATQT